MFAIIGIVVVFGAIVAGYLMEKGKPDGAGAAGRVDHHRRSGAGDAVHRQSHAHYQVDGGRGAERVEGISVWQGALSRHAEDDVRVF